MFPRQLKEYNRVIKKYKMTKFIEKELRDDMIGRILSCKEIINFYNCPVCDVKTVEDEYYIPFSCKICGGNSTPIKVTYVYVTGIEVKNNHRLHRINGFFANSPEECLLKKSKDGIFPLKHSMFYQGGLLVSSEKFVRK